MDVYVNGLLNEILRTPIEAAGNTYVMELPDDVTKKLPLVFAGHSAGSEHPSGFADWAAITVDAYAASDSVARRAAQDVRDVLTEAWKTQTEYGEGYIGRMETPVPPFPFPRDGMPGDLFRYTAEYRLLLRPSRVIV